MLCLGNGRGRGRQYFNGCESSDAYIAQTKTCSSYRSAENRIDFIFAKGAAADSILGASHDINCGVDDPPPDLTAFPPRCSSEPQNWGNPRRYSDHRLVWTRLSLEE